MSDQALSDENNYIFKCIFFNNCIFFLDIEASNYYFQKIEG